jgi:hypothetical protein
MFADDSAALPGARLQERFAIVPHVECHAGLLWRNAIVARTGPALQVAGWTTEPGNATVLAVIITDERGIIRGFGSHVTRLGSLIPGLLAPVEHGWLGAIADYDERATYRVHAVRAGGREVCEAAVLAPAVRR